MNFEALQGAMFARDLGAFKRDWIPRYANSCDRVWGSTPLHEVVSWGNRYEFVEFMLENGADPNTQTLYSGSPPLMFGWNTNETSVERVCIRVALLKKGANPFIRNKHRNDTYWVARQTNVPIDYLDSFLLAELVCGGADDLPLDLWRVVKPFIYNI